MADEPQASPLAPLGARSTSSRPTSFGRWASGWWRTCRPRKCWPRSARKCWRRPSCRWRSISCWASCGTRACSARRWDCLPHYFTPFQAFVIQESENERLRFDLRVGLEILRREAEYRAGEPTRAGHFSLSVRSAVPQSAGLRPRAGGGCRRSGVRRNVARLDSQAAAADRHGRIADLIYVHSEYYWQRKRTAGVEDDAASRDAARMPTDRARRLGREPRTRRRRPVRRARRPDRPGQSPEGSAVFCFPRCSGNWATRRCRA